MGEIGSRSPTESVREMDSMRPELNTSGSAVRETGAGPGADAGDHCVTVSAACSVACSVDADRGDPDPFEAAAGSGAVGALGRGSLAPIDAASRASTAGRNISSVGVSSGIARKGGSGVTETVGVTAAGTGSAGTGGGTGAASPGAATCGATSSCATSTGAVARGTTVDPCGCSVCATWTFSLRSGPTPD